MKPSIPSDPRSGRGPRPTRPARACLAGVAALASLLTACSPSEPAGPAARPAGLSSSQPTAGASPSPVASADAVVGATTAAPDTGALAPFLQAVETLRRRLTIADAEARASIKGELGVVTRAASDAVRAADVAAAERAVPPGVSGPARALVMTVLSDLGAWRSSLAAFAEPGLVVLREDTADWSRQLAEVRRELARSDEGRSHLDGDVAALVVAAQTARVPAEAPTSRAAAETALLVGFVLHPAACGDAVWVERTTEVPRLTWVDASGSTRAATLVSRGAGGGRLDSSWTMRWTTSGWQVRGRTC